MTSRDPGDGMSGVPALELRRITKRYPGVLANDQVDLVVQQGTVHALVGENGAGKSTLLGIASGLVTPDTGDVRIGGVLLGRGGPRRAMALGLGMVQQNWMLVPDRTVAENVVLGRETRRGLWFDRALAVRQVEVVAGELGFDLDPRARIDELSAGAMQRVEIVKALCRPTRTLVLDEPTSVLAPQEVEDLFKVLRRFVGQGRTVLLISHRLGEVLDLADTVTVLRKGRIAGEFPLGTANEAELAEHIVGHPVQPVRRSKNRTAVGREILRLEDVSTAGGRARLRNVSLQVRAGEVLGIAGVEGNGQETLAHVVLGLVPVRSGRVWLDGQDVTHEPTARRRAAGLAFVPADRAKEGLVASFRLDENLILGQHKDPGLGRNGWLDPGRVQRRARGLLDEFDVRPASPELAGSSLSGGNQQKLVLAREISSNPKLLVLAHPTSGVDVGGIEFLHRKFLEASQDGSALLLISPDLGEILQLSDRIAVLYAGKVAGVVQAQKADPGQLGAWMTGATQEAGA